MKAVIVIAYDADCAGCEGAKIIDRTREVLADLPGVEAHMAIRSTAEEILMVLEEDQS